MTYKSFYRLSTKFMQKYNVYHVNNLKVLYKKKLFSPHPKQNFCLNKNMPNYNRFHVNSYLKATCNILINCIRQTKSESKIYYTVFILLNNFITETKIRQIKCICSVLFNLILSQSLSPIFSDFSY